MKNFLINLVVAFLLFIGFDILWFKTLGLQYFYNPQFEVINGKKFKLRIWAGLLVWFFLALASTMLVQYSDIDNLGVFLYGMFVGFIIYAVYNFTNYATIQKYSIKTVAADTLWGTLLFGVVSIICNQISIN